MCPPTVLDGQAKWESGFQKEDQKAGWAGWKLGRDGCKPILQMRNGKPREGQGLAGTQSLGTTESRLQTEAPSAFPLLGSRRAGAREGTVLPAG